jgi:hypothetical protein
MLWPRKHRRRTCLTSRGASPPDPPGGCKGRMLRAEAYARFIQLYLIIFCSAQCIRPMRPPNASAQCIRPMHPPNASALCICPMHPPNASAQCVRPLHPPNASADGGVRGVTPPSTSKSLLQFSPSQSVVPRFLADSNVHSNTSLI